MKAVWKKLKSRRGFTLAELLMVLLIMLMVGSMATVGVSSAKNAYTKVIDGANAQVLLSTTISSLRRELALASAVETSGTTMNSYTNGENGYSYTLKCGAVNSGYPGIYRELQNSELTVYSEDPDKQCELLVTQKAATEDMIASFDSISYSNGVFTVNGLRVVKNGKTLAQLDADNPLQIRAVVGIA